MPGLGSRIAQRLLFPPKSLLDWLTRKPKVVDGEAIDRHAQWILAVANATGRSMPSMGPRGARRYYAQLSWLLEAQPPEIEEARDVELNMRDGNTCRARVYRPKGAPASKPLPGLVFFHGGGHTIGSIETHDVFCQRLCAGSGCIVVSVNYRLAPEEPFPAALHDSYDATVDVARRADEFGIDRGRLAVGGDSAGGNLAAAVSIVARDEQGPPICLQLLIYPGVGGIDHPGRQNPGLQEGFGLDAKTTRWFYENYLGDHTDADPRFSPLFLENHAGLPPALVVIAHFDVLRGEGIEYAEKLEAAGVPVTRLRYADLLHGFVTMSILPRAAEAITEIAESLRVLHDD